MAAYLTVAEAQEYFDNYRLITSAWDNASLEEQGKALNIGTRQIDALSYDGDKADDSQELQFPRGSDTEVPQDIKDACAECAYSILDGVEVEYEYDNLRSQSMGFANVRSSSSKDFLPEYKLAGIPSYIAWNLLVSYLRNNDSVTIMRTS